MDYRFADRAVIEWSQSQKRFELALWEGEHVLHLWTLPEGFTSLDAKIRANLLGIEYVNALLAGVKIDPSGADGSWVEDGSDRWVRKLFAHRRRGKYDH